MDSFANVINLPNLHSISIKLDHSNYVFWRTQILSTTRAHGFDDLLDKFQNPPIQFLPTPTGERHANPDFISWIRRDQFLMSWMLSSISESMLGNITRCATARDVWLVLEGLFQSQSKARIMQLKLQLQTQKKGDLCVDDYVLKMRGIADLLAAAGHSISDDDLALQILAGFGFEYDAVVANFTNRPDSLNLQEVHFALQAHEIRLQSQQSISFPSAHLTYNCGGNISAAQFGGVSRGAPMNRGRGGRFISRDRVICQLCGKPGHLALKCFKRFDVHFTSIPAPPPQSPQAYFTDFTNFDNFQGDLSYGQDYDASWYVDSGATTHITNDFANLQVSTPYQGADQVAVGNENQLSIDAVGKSSFSALSHPLILNNILYVPQITKNLVSISQFTKDNAVIVEFHSDACFVKDKTTLQILMKGALVRGLYQLDLSKLKANRGRSSVQLCQASPTLSKTSNVCCNLSSVSSHRAGSSYCSKAASITSKPCSSLSDVNKVATLTTTSVQDVNIWHRKLGHPSLSTLTQLQNILPGYTHKSKLLFCDACKQGKLHQTPHITQPLRTTKPFQLVHSDLWGPAFTASAYGYKYYIHFIDDYTRYTWIYPLTVKSEAAQVVKNFFQMVQCQFQCSIQAFQSDWGGGVNIDPW